MLRARTIVQPFPQITTAELTRRIRVSAADLHELAATSRNLIDESREALQLAAQTRYLAVVNAKKA